MTPPPAESVAAMIRPAPRPPDSQVNRDLLAPMEGASLGYWLLLGISVAFVGLAGGIWIYQVYRGLGIAGYYHPIFWGAYIVTFVFWVGIAHAGTLISAILFLFRAKWRNAINRSAEAMTVIAVLTAAQFLGIHVGRIWKSYFILPYPNQRGLWVNFKSPLLWDTFAITTYATISIVFLYVGLIPDLAIARDRAVGWRKLLYSILSLGWQGTASQWKVAQPQRAAPLGARDAAGALRAQRRVLGLRRVDRARLARHDLRPLLRRGRDLLRLRDGADGDDPGAADLRARGVHHQLPLREHVPLPAAHVDHRDLRLRRRVLHGLVQRRRVRADGVLQARLRSRTGSRPGR